MAAVASGFCAIVATCVLVQSELAYMQVRHSKRRLCCFDQKLVISVA